MVKRQSTGAPPASPSLPPRSRTTRPPGDPTERFGTLAQPAERLHGRQEVSGPDLHQIWSVGSFGRHGSTTVLNTEKTAKSETDSVALLISRQELTVDPGDGQADVA